jgi:hypothetical protein
MDVVFVWWKINVAMEDADLAAHRAAVALVPDRDVVQDQDPVAHLAVAVSLVVHAANPQLIRKHPEAAVAVKNHAEAAQRVHLNAKHLAPDLVNVIRTSLAAVIAVYRRDRTEIEAVIDLVPAVEHPMFPQRESLDHARKIVTKAWMTNRYFVKLLSILA